MGETDHEVSNVRRCVRHNCWVNREVRGSILNGWPGRCREAFEDAQRLGDPGPCDFREVFIGTEKVGP